MNKNKKKQEEPNTNLNQTIKMKKKTKQILNNTFKLHKQQQKPYHKSDPKQRRVDYLETDSSGRSGDDFHGDRMIEGWLFQRDVRRVEV